MVMLVVPKLTNRGLSVRVSTRRAVRHAARLYVGAQRWRAVRRRAGTRYAAL